MGACGSRKLLIMKNRFKILFLIFTILTLSGCSIFRGPTAVEKQKKAVQGIELSQKNIVAKTSQIEDKGKAFLYGAKYSLEHETNKTVPVLISEKFLDLSTLSIGQPSLTDAQKIREITDDLLKESDRKIAVANLQLAQTEGDKKKFEKEALNYKKQVESGEKQLKLLENSVSLLQGQEKLLKGEYDKKLGEAQKIAEVNATKASQWDEENSLINSLNPFRDLFKFIKKLFVLSLIGGAIFIIFHVLEVFFPALGVVSLIGSTFIKVISKFVPKAISGAGFVSSKIKDSLKAVTTGLQHTIDTLKVNPIEDKILNNLKENDIFDKNDVKKFLETHTENILELIKNEQDEHQDNSIKTEISNIKNEIKFRSST